MEGIFPIPADVAKSDRCFEYKYVVYTKKSKKGEITVFEQLADYGVRVQGIVNRWLEISQFASPGGKFDTLITLAIHKIHCKNKFDVLTTEWLPWLQTS